MGVDRMRPVAGPREVTAGDGQGWLRPHGVVVDARQAETLLSRFDPATGEQRPLQVGDHLVMNHRGMQVEGLANAPLTAGFLPIMWADYQTAEELIGSSETRSASFVLVGLDSETDAQAVADRIARSTGLAAYPTAAWIERNRTWMLTNSAIPLNFGITIAMGFLIGLAIAGQVFHQFVRDHTREFAVLRALGCGRLRLAMMVLVQALVTGFLGFGVGVGLAAVFDRAVQNTMLVSHLTGDLLVTTAIAVGIIVAVASLAGMWRVLRLDPAEVFRG
jgi:putative ABC transport system permease protein